MAVSEQQMKMAEELLFSGKPTTSFAKLLYFGIFDSHRIFPYPQVSPEEKQRVDGFLRKLKAFADEHLDPAWIDRNATIPRPVIDGLGKLGLLGLTIPKEYGGLEFTQYGYCKAEELIARRCGSTALFINAHQSIGLKALLLFGTKEQREYWLPPLARGEFLAAFSLTESTAGSDAAGIKTRAVFDPVKNVYRITGQKQWTTNGSIAKMLTVMAKMEVDTPTGKQDKITAFIVTPDMPGFKVTVAALEKLGMRGTATTNLAYENVEVPAKNILGPIGGGLKVALTVLDYGRTTFGATCTGAAKELLELTIKHASTRYQFDRPLAGFALVKKKIATMASLVYAMDAATYLTAGLIDRGEEDIMLETAILKVFTSDSLWSILYDSMQILGGRSFFTDAPYERMMRDARLNTIGEGSNEVLRAFIGAVGLRDVGKQLEAIAGILHNPRTGFQNLTRFGRHHLNLLFRAPLIPIQSKEIALEGHQLGRAIRRLGMVIPWLLAKHRENIIEQQIILDRLATITIAIYTATAVLSKLDSDLIQTGEKSCNMANDLVVGKFYCHEAFTTIDRCLDSLFQNYDATVEAVSDQLTGYKES